MNFCQANASPRAIVARAMTASIALIAVCTQVTVAQHSGDIYIGVEGDAMVTGAVEADATISAPERVFVGTFGDSGFPHFTANPGFDTLPGTFQPGTSIGFDILEPLLIFNGDGFETTGGETLEIKFLSLSVTTASGPVPGFALAVQPNGGFHRHYQMFLNAPGALGDPAPGIFLLARQMWSTDPAIPVPTEPFYLLLNNGRPIDELTAAAAWLESWLAGDEPTCPADLNGSGVVDGADLGLLLQAWGSADIAADLNGDGTVDGADLGLLLQSWGACEPPRTVTP